MARFSGENLRKARGLTTQSDLAGALRRRGFGTTQTQISRWEDGQTPRKYILDALAEELGVAAEDLFVDEDEERDMNAPLTRATVRQIIREEARAVLREVVVRS